MEQQDSTTQQGPRGPFARLAEKYRRFMYGTRIESWGMCVPMLPVRFEGKWWRFVAAEPVDENTAAVQLLPLGHEDDAPAASAEPRTIITAEPPNDLRSPVGVVKVSVTLVHHDNDNED